MKKKDSFDISVVIVTRNRNEELKLCLKSIKSSELKFQLIVIDQSDEEKAKKNLLLVSQIKGAVYRRQLKLGKSRGLNAALKLVTAPVVAFTDDDCVVEKNWLNSIRHRFLVEQNVVGVFGRTLPFHPERHPNKICPCVFDRPDEKLIAKPGKHWEQIGFGNNMAFKVDVFERIGFFNELLGPELWGGRLRMRTWPSDV
jgi:GT2 family glycosyltransferase